MNRIRGLSFAAAVILSGLVLSWPARPDQHATCTMDEKDHVAKYSCPDGYEVVYTGEGTKVCDGACFRKDDSKNLQGAIQSIIVNRWGKEYLPAATHITWASDELLMKGKANIVIPQKGTFEFKVPRPQR